MGLRREVPNWHSSQALEWVLPTFFQGFFGVGKRELDILRSTGAIEFIGPSKTGGYQLRLVMSE